MARTTTWLLVLALTCTTAAAGASAGDGRQASKAQGTGRIDKPDKAQPASAVPPVDARERRKWWLYDRDELGIPEQQSAAINDIFEANLPKLRETWQELERAEAELSRTIKEHKADLATVSLLLDRVESARSQHNKLRTLMLYRIHSLLSEEQRVKLEALRARNAARDRPGDSPGDRR